MKKLRWCQEDIEKLTILYSNTKHKELEKIFNRKSNYINMKAKSLGLKKMKNLYSPNNVRILNNGSLESCYWIGFLLADGHFTVNRLFVTLAKKDANHLIKFSKYIGIHHINYRLVKSQFGLHEAVNISAMDSEYIPLLINKFQINHNKTISPPKFIEYDLTQKQMLSLIIGFIDGDGHVGKLKRLLSPYYIRIKIHKNWLNNLIFINEFIQKYFNVTSKMKAKLNQHNYADLIISNSIFLKEIKKFIELNELPVLERKWSFDCFDFSKNKTVYIKGIKYQSLGAASKILNISRYKLKKYYITNFQEVYPLGKQVPPEKERPRRGHA